MDFEKQALEIYKEFGSVTPALLMRKLKINRNLAKKIYEKINESQTKLNNGSVVTMAEENSKKQKNLNKECIEQLWEPILMGFVQELTRAELVNQDVTLAQVNVVIKNFVNKINI